MNRKEQIYIHDFKLGNKKNHDLFGIFGFKSEARNEYVNNLKSS